LPFLLGEKIEVSFIKANFPNAIIIPKTALFKELDKSFVFTINNSETLKKEVKYYYESDTYFVIETGLEIGEEIILNYNIENLSEGKRVK
jgi:HlyD family secretion protein